MRIRVVLGETWGEVEVPDELVEAAAGGDLAKRVDFLAEEAKPAIYAALQLAGDR